MSALRVLAVVDSAVLREILREQLTEARGFELLLAADPHIAALKLARSPPDVVMVHQPMPDAEPLLARLHAAGIPTVLSTLRREPDQLDAALSELADRLREVVSRSRTVRTGTGPPPRHGTPARATSDLVVAFGSSTGGTDALRTVLSALGCRPPGIVVVQHMPGAFTGAFAERLAQVTALCVREARDGDAVGPGRVLIAPGGRHMRVVRQGSGFAVEVFDGPAVGHHRPSVDLLFRSVAEAAGPRAIGVILTGMGADGADGLAAMRRAGAATFAQDEQSSVVFGMPGRAIGLGAVDQVVPLDQIGPRVLLAVAGRTIGAGPGA